MNAAQLDRDIADIKGDIRSVVLELTHLQSEHQTLLEELQQLEKTQSQEFESESPDSSENSKKNTNGTNTHPEIDTYIPQIIRHEHFDSAISHFFTANGTSETPAKRPKLSKLSENLLQRSERLVNLKENILYENIYRLVGVTAFPLNKFTFSAGDEVLGIRFDVYSHTRSCFLSPHYAILKKIVAVDKEEAIVKNWTLYRHTLPVYLPLDQLQKDLQCSTSDSQAIFDFALEVRNHLVKTQYKSDKIDQLQKITLGNIGFNSNISKTVISKLEKDIQCQRVMLSIRNRTSLTKKTHSIEIFCSEDVIEIANVDLVDIEDKKKLVLLYESILKNSAIDDLLKNFRKVFEHMANHNII
ncbi:hypothetical protein G9P44_002210 [Scheffersomyces stipitis]|nr:hypothetical protein G9P44_002210 [Scheffersomyces stipitis]